MMKGLCGQSRDSMYKIKIMGTKHKEIGKEKGP